MNKKENKNVLSIVACALLAILNVLLISALVLVTRYANVQKNIFILINILILAILLLVNLIGVCVYRKDDKTKIIYSSIVGVLTILLIIVNFYIVRINSSINKVTETGDTTTTTAEVAFVTYNNNIIVDEKDIEGCKFGIIDNENFLEGNVLAKAELEAKKINVTYVEYGNYNDLFLGLAAGEVDVAALPSNYYDMLVVNEGYEEILANAKTIYKFSKVVEVANSTDTSVDITSEPFTVLLIGNDGGRSDALLVATVNPKTLDVSLISIPRDTYVPIACYSGGSRDKINHARSVSRQCTIDTVENFLDTKINFYVETNFKGVVQIVDAMGGVQIDSPAEFDAQNSDENRGTFSVHIFKGVQTVDGEGALAYARERHAFADGDYARGQHQIEVIQAMVTKAYSIRDVNKLLNVLDAAGENVTTNMSIDQITTLINYLFKTISSTYINSEKVLNIDSEQIPGYPSYYYNYSYGQPLWISIPYKGGVADAKAILTTEGVKSSEKSLSKPDPFTYFATDSYGKAKRISTFYNETLEVIEMPDFMPSMVNGKMSYADAKAWASARGISLNVNYVRRGDADYSESLPDGYILTQSVKYGTLTADFSSLTISVIQQVQPEDMVPDFKGKNYQELINWANSNGYSHSFTWQTGDSTNAGTIIEQSIVAGELKAEHNSISATAYDYPDVTSSFKSAAKDKSSIDTWATTNLINGVNGVKYSYVYSTSQPNGSIKSWSATNYTGNATTSTVKTNSTISVVLYSTDQSLATKYTVTFVDKDGNTLKTEEVLEGGSATAPTAPTVSGFEFTGWDKSFSSVTENITVKAQYKEVSVTPPEESGTPTTPPTGSDPNSNPTPPSSEPGQSQE